MENPEQREEIRQGVVSSEIVCSNQKKIKMSMIYSNFDILDKPWWKHPLDERNTEYLISNIKHLQQAIKLAVNDKKDGLFWKGYIDLHFERYLLECVSAEGNIILSSSYIQKLLKKPCFLKIFCEQIFINCIQSDKQRLSKKIQNLHGAIIDIFPPIFFPDLQIDRFIPDFAKQLHRKIGNGLIKDAGQYRTKFVKAAQEDHLEEAIKYGACFLSHFLEIHPFINGNGRVARLLLSYLLSKFTVVPLSLYIGSKSRDVYLQCLREAQCQYPFNPSALASFILECVYMTSYNICVVMDIDA
ncbi:1446_t:CDS:2 [Gigaspora rosea]|nr:1446_t:CDS:2 [Gigaspora rosea]